MDMEIGEWNQIQETGQKGSWINYKAPRDANSLRRFSEHVASWLPSGSWKIFQIDNSTSLDAVEEFLLGRFLFSSDRILDLTQSRTFLFEFGDDTEENENSEMVIAHLIYFFLLFECHGYVVSSGGDGQILGVQDGYAIFISKDEDSFSAKRLLQKFEDRPEQYPEWVGCLVARRQQKKLDNC
ncbi:MAG: hypothetical protein HZB57_08215 [Gammaproteobacteria bacterium]|nr:hypothetical protein [Gammaproteobacteria bacterium]